MRLTYVSVRSFGKPTIFGAPIFIPIFDPTSTKVLVKSWALPASLSTYTNIQVLTSTATNMSFPKFLVQSQFWLVVKQLLLKVIFSASSTRPLIFSGNVSRDRPQCESNWEAFSLPVRKKQITGRQRNYINFRDLLLTDSMYFCNAFTRSIGATFVWVARFRIIVKLLRKRSSSPVK